MWTGDCPWPSVIPAVRAPADLRQLPPAWQGAIAFLLGGSLAGVAPAVKEAQAAGWQVYIHVDMVRELAPSEDSMAFFRDYVHPDGVISTHTQTVLRARRAGLMTVQRIFLLDSQSVETGLTQVRSAQADAVEMLPGLLPDVLSRIAHKVHQPTIAGGLITGPDEVERALAAGACSVSTSARGLWSYRPTSGQRPRRTLPMGDAKRSER